MKKQLTILSLILTTAGFSAFGQGWLTFASGTSGVWDQFTTPGVGIKAPVGDVNLAFLWNTTSGTDLLPAVGSQFGTRGTNFGGTVGNQVATNGVSGIVNGWSTIATMIASGWQWGKDQSSGSIIAIGGSTTGGAFSYPAGAPTTMELLGSTASEVVQIIVVGWDATSGTTPGSSVDMGWSNPFDYTTGTSASDNVATVLMSVSGINQFGIAMIPEPSTLALAGLGGLSLLLFRRRK